MAIKKLPYWLGGKVMKGRHIILKSLLAIVCSIQRFHFGRIYDYNLPSSHRKSGEGSKIIFFLSIIFLSSNIPIVFKPESLIFLKIFGGNPIQIFLQLLVTVISSN